MNATVASFAEAIETVKYYKSVADQIPSFVVPVTIRNNWLNASQQYEQGHPDAAKSANTAIEGLHATMTAFIRNSVIRKEGTDKMPYFLVSLDQRREQDYDGDLISRLEAQNAALVDAVRAETNGKFDQRLKQYVAGHELLKEIDAEQERRRRKNLADEARAIFG